jgi:hypothetical protein
MSFKMSHISAFFGLGVLIILASGTLARTQSETPRLLSLESLKTIHFTKAGASDQAAALSYSDLSDVIAACRAYSRGLPTDEPAPKGMRHPRSSHHVDHVPGATSIVVCAILNS